MIELTKRNILEAKVEALVNAVNTQGVMGKGLALQFKISYPEMFKDYKIACKSGCIRIGKVYIYETNNIVGPKYIINFPTKINWRETSNLDYIRSGLISLQNEIITRDIKSIAIPPLGCGLGGLLWEDVRLLINSYLSDIPNTKIIVFQPKDLLINFVKFHPEIIHLAEILKSNNPNPSFSDLENLLKEYNAKIEDKSPARDFEIEL